MDTNEGGARNPDSRTLVDRYGSVEIALSNSGQVYLFRIRDIPFSGIGILVKKNSDILNHLKVGDKLNMKYNPIAASGLPEYLNTKIDHIIKDDNGRFKGHYVLNLSVCEN